MFPEVSFLTFIKGFHVYFIFFFSGGVLFIILNIEYKSVLHGEILK